MKNKILILFITFSFFISYFAFDVYASETTYSGVENGALIEWNNATSKSYSWFSTGPSTWTLTVNTSSVDLYLFHINGNFPPIDSIYTSDMYVHYFIYVNSKYTTFDPSATFTPSTVTVDGYSRKLYFRNIPNVDFKAIVECHTNNSGRYFIVDSVTDFIKPKKVGVKVGSMLVSNDNITQTFLLGEYDVDGDSTARPMGDSGAIGSGHKMKNAKPRPGSTVKVNTDDGRTLETPITVINPRVFSDDYSATLSFNPSLIADYHKEESINIDSIEFEMEFDIENIEDNSITNQSYIYNYDYSDKTITYSYVTADTIYNFTSNGDTTVNITQDNDSNVLLDSSGILQSIFNKIGDMVANTISSLIGGISSISAFFSGVIGALGGLFSSFGVVVGMIFGTQIGTIVTIGFGLALLSIILALFMKR